MPAGAVTLFHLRGIRIGADYSWFLVLFLIIILLSGSYRDALGADQDAIGPYALAVATALLFFGSILLHELGHAIVAIRNGIGIAGITLWMFGGVARLQRDSDSPGTEFKIAIAGPLVTAAIVVVCVAAGLLLAGDEFRDALTEEGASTSGLAEMLAWLATINLLVLLFNLVPAFPLDGGRIARAIAWKLTGNRTSATRFAAALGQGFGYLLIGAGGALLLVSGDVINGIWLAVVGFILTSAARGAVAQTELTSRIEGVSVGDVMDREPVAIPSRLSVERALDEYFLRYQGWPWFPVIDDDARFIGVLDSVTAGRIAEGERHGTSVGAILARDEGSATIRDDAPLEDALGNEALRRLGALVAVDPLGRISGVLTASDVGRALRR
jgi:Zn-dependent protease